MLDSGVVRHPKLSVIVALKASSRQAANCLHSLSAAFQANVSADDYEILVVETRSADMLGEHAALAAAGNVRYHCLEEAARWRARAIEHGIQQARAAFVGILLDGGHILTPRVLEHALLAARFGERPLVVVPAYRIDELEPASSGPESSAWRADPYLLFDQAEFGPANLNGFLGPLIGASCMFFPVASYHTAGGVRSDVDFPGGGALSLSLYTNLSRLAATRLIVLAGEGAFRQPHPEVTTPSSREAEAGVQSVLEDRVLPLGFDFRPVHREPIAFGPIPGPAQRFVVESAGVASFHCMACAQRGEPAWYEDP